MKTPEQELLPWTELEPYFDRALQLEPQACESWLTELSTTRGEVAQAVRALLAEREALNAAGFLEGSAFAGAQGFAPALRDMVARRAARHTNSAASTTPRIPGLAADAVMYELLTGVRPYRGHSSRAALEEAILKEDLRQPSQVSISTQAATVRGTSARTLARSLAGDLDTIVAKSLKKNPLERYPSVTAFAQDILNHLHSLPVSARPDSLWYRVGRFTARYKVPVAAASVAVVALLSGATVALWQAQEAAAERDRAVAFASRHQAVTEFLGRVITDAAASATPITVTELLTRSEKLALNNTSDSPENRAAVLEMIAERYLYNEELDRAAQLMKSALALLPNSSDQALRSRLSCRLAITTAEVGTAEAAIQLISHEVDQLTDDPRTASQCLLELTRLESAEHHAQDALRHAELGLERIRAAGPGSENIEGALLGAAAFAHHLSGRDAVAERYFAQALQKYRDIGREQSDGALTVLSDWGTAIASAGMPRRAVPLFEQAERIEREREAGAEPSTTTVGNRGLSLLSLGRIDAARSAFDLECQLAVKHKDSSSEAHCLLGLARLSLQTAALDDAARYLDRAVQVVGPNTPASNPFMRLMNVLHGRLDLAQGRTAEAGERFERALADKSVTPTTVGAFIGQTEVALIQGNSARAVETARLALQTAASLQGDLPYSNYTGLASLALAQALKQFGDPVGARKSLDAAVAQLSNTVDTDHPALQQARQLLHQT